MRRPHAANQHNVARPRPDALLIALDAVLRRDGGPAGQVAAEVLGFIREVRAAGRPVALLANGTDRLDADLAALGLAGEFDAVLNSADLGVAKPARDFYLAACRAVATPPERCLVVDGGVRDVAGARAAGLSGFRWSGPPDLPYLRAALGITTEPYPSG